MNAEHGEENVQVKAHDMYIDEWIEFKAKEFQFGVVRVFLAIQRN